jgi:hypothetical protein
MQRKAPVLHLEAKVSRCKGMAADWHFFQGVRGEWRWYRVDQTGQVVKEADTAFDDMDACMADAQRVGFGKHAFAVHARSDLAKFPRRRLNAADAPLERRRARRPRQSPRRSD